MLQVLAIPTQPRILSPLDVLINWMTSHMRDREIHTLYKMHIVKEKNAHSYTFIPGNGISDLLLPLLCWKLLVNAIMKYLLAIWQTNGSVENYGEALRKYKACVKISSDMDK